jgi:hypothetical protein
MEQYTKPNFTMRALIELRPGSEFSLLGEEVIWEEEYDADGVVTGNYVAKNLEWLSNTPIPSKEELQSKLAEVESDWNSTEYQRLRQPEYPPLADLADALYWQAQGDESKMTAYLAAVDAVKQKYPKGV